MRSHTCLARHLGRLCLFIILLPGLPAMAAGFVDGEVAANSELSAGGTTLTADQMLDMMVVAPRPTIPPPLPSSAPALASLEGNMRTWTMHAEGSITGVFNQGASGAISRVDFVDNLIVNADGIDAGTELIVEVTWKVGGLAEYTTTNGLRNHATLLRTHL